MEFQLKSTPQNENSTQGTQVSQELAPIQPPITKSAVSQPLGITPGPVSKSAISTGTASQPFGTIPESATKSAISTGTASQAHVTTPVLVNTISSSPKRPRTVFGRSMRCNKCAEVRRNLNYEIAMLKKSRAADRKEALKVTLQNTTLRESRIRMENSIKFLEGLVTTVQKECIELRNKNKKLLSQQSEITRILMK